MRSIADANVLLPLLTDGHAHRAPAATWWDACDDGDVGLCLPVRMALLRLLTNSRVMGSSILRPEQAWDVLGQLTDDPRIVVIDQAPQTHAQHWRANVEKREPGSLAIAPSLEGRGAVLRETPFSPPDLWTDAWLAALAQAPIAK